jgi:hypothetical protein
MQIWRGELGDRAVATYYQDAGERLTRYFSDHVIAGFLCFGTQQRVEIHHVVLPLGDTLHKNGKAWGGHKLYRAVQSVFQCFG